jgi:hypothetical protein
MVWAGLGGEPFAAACSRTRSRRRTWWCVHKAHAAPKTTFVAGGAEWGWGRLYRSVFPNQNETLEVVVQPKTLQLY